MEDEDEDLIYPLEITQGDGTKEVIDVGSKWRLFPWGIPAKGTGGSWKMPKAPDKIGTDQTKYNWVLSTFRLVFHYFSFNFRYTSYYDNKG